MLVKEVDFKLLDFVETVDGNCYTIGFLDNVYKKTISKKTAYSMYDRGQIIRKSEMIKGEIVFENLLP
ncbi:hypothetical protein [Metaplanococcus flavidus]|uniref:Uncharacterized protein n=1 Tax=Metaplanococcus flavidus TaxID=569883 RepID=A0ABW3L645_9BACL